MNSFVQSYHLYELSLVFFLQVLNMYPSGRHFSRFSLSPLERPRLPGPSIGHHITHRSQVAIVDLEKAGIIGKKHHPVDIQSYLLRFWSSKYLLNMCLDVQGSLWFWVSTDLFLAINLTVYTTHMGKLLSFLNAKLGDLCILHFFNPFFLWKTPKRRRELKRSQQKWVTRPSIIPQAGKGGSYFRMTFSCWSKKISRFSMVYQPKKTLFVVN